MASTRPNADGIETLLNRLSAAIDQITKASEKQAREIDKQLKRLVDRGEKSTERLLKTIDKEIKAQITSLRRELHDVERRVTEMRQAGKKQLATKQAAKQAPKVQKEKSVTSAKDEKTKTKVKSKTKVAKVIAPAKETPKAAKAK